MEKRSSPQLLGLTDKVESYGQTNRIDQYLCTPIVRQSTIFLNEEEEQRCNTPAYSHRSQSSASYFQDIEKITASTPSCFTSSVSKCNLPYKSYTPRKPGRSIAHAGTFTSTCLGSKQEILHNLDEKIYKPVEKETKAPNVMSTFNSHLKKCKFSIFSKEDKTISKVGVYSSSKSAVSKHPKNKCVKKISEILTDRK